MNNQFKERFIRMLYPYIIVLKQGCTRPQDPFDFSLALLHRYGGETLPKPPVAPAKEVVFSAQELPPVQLKSPKAPKTSVYSRRKKQSQPK